MKKISEENIKKLKKHIADSPDADDFTKKAIFLLIDASNGLSEPVRVRGKIEGKEIDIHNMVSSNCKTHLSEFARLLGADVVFCNWGSAVDIADGYFTETKRRQVSFTTKEIESVDLSVF